jgi:hypothetical protein
VVVDSRERQIIRHGRKRPDRRCPPIREPSDWESQLAGPSGEPCQCILGARMQSEVRRCTVPVYRMEKIKAGLVNFLW